MTTGDGRSDPFGLESDGWIERLREAEAPFALGRLGAYELLGEIGRGGQGVVFRARQPGTNREIAVKRLLAGSFASPAEQRRFEREVEAVSSLHHPGVVAVLAFERVDGLPVLAMECVDGVSLTSWASGKSHEEIVAQLLQTCDAVEHAHQRGVLHRDLKPNNVLVDRAGHARVLDFGMAKRTQESATAITASGGFVGTPAYAAPEQWRGEELDVRADVYSIGALLFETLTGRRVVEGDALAALARALQPETPPRPSALVPSIPRELDAIVLKALAHERERRYQSVDALASDLRRLQSGEPVLAHPPGTGYLLRKLVARNRVVTALLAALLLSGVAYVVAAVRNARLLEHERDLALASGEREHEARAAAEEGEHRADDARAEAERERERAQAERDTAQALLGFMADDVLGAVDPLLHGHDPKLVDVLVHASGRAGGRFAELPEAEAAMRVMLARGLATLGRYELAERELRAALALQVPAAREAAEMDLAIVLTELRRFDEARPLLEEQLAFYAELAAAEGADTTAAEQHARALDRLATVAYLTGSFDEALELRERALPLIRDPELQLTARLNVALSLKGVGRQEDAIAVWRSVIAERPDDGGMHVANAHANLGTTLLQLGEYSEAEPHLRKSLELSEHLYGPEHAQLIVPLSGLALALRAQQKWDEAVEVARRNLAIAEASAPKGPFTVGALFNFAALLEARGEPGAAVELLRRAEALVAERGDDPTQVATALVRCLVGSGRAEDAQPILDRLATAKPTAPSAGWFLVWRGAVLEARGELVDAALAFEEGIPRLAGQDAQFLRPSLGAYARILRALDSPDEALEVERRLRELDETGETGSKR